MWPAASNIDIKGVSATEAYVDDAATLDDVLGNAHNGQDNGCGGLDHGLVVELIHAKSMQPVSYTHLTLPTKA